MDIDDIQQIGRVTSVLQICIEKLDNIAKNSGADSPATQCAENAAEWVQYALDAVCDSLSYEPHKDFK